MLKMSYSLVELYISVWPTDLFKHLFNGFFMVSGTDQPIWFRCVSVFFLFIFKSAALRRVSEQQMNKQPTAEAQTGKALKLEFTHLQKHHTSGWSFSKLHNSEKPSDRLSGK